MKIMEGTCSRCGGPVVCNFSLFRWKRDQGRCLQCGARRIGDYGPVVQTAPPAEVSFKDFILTVLNHTQRQDERSEDAEEETLN